MSSGDNKAELGQCPLCKNDVPVRTSFRRVTGDSRYSVRALRRVRRRQAVHPGLSGTASRIRAFPALPVKWRRRGRRSGSPTPISAKPGNSLRRPSQRRPVGC